MNLFAVDITVYQPDDDTGKRTKTYIATYELEFSKISKVAKGVNPAFVEVHSITYIGQVVVDGARGLLPEEALPGRVGMEHAP